MKTTINQRIIKFIENQGISAYKLAKEIGTSEAVISNIKTEKNKPNIEIVEKILNKYEGLDANWLINGTGNMVKNNTGNVANGNGIIQQSPNSKIHQIIAKDEAIIADQKKEIQALKKRIKELEIDKEQLTTEKKSLYDILKNIKK